VRNISVIVIGTKEDLSSCGQSGSRKVEE